MKFLGFNFLGKSLILFGLLLILLGVFFTFFEKIPFIGKLPGDIYYQGKNWSFYFPITTCIIISIILTIILSLIFKK